MKEGVKLVTTPLDIALGISKKLAQSAIVAKVDGGVWDMFRPLEADCTLELCSFEDPDGKEVCPWLCHHCSPARGDSPLPAVVTRHATVSSWCSLDALTLRANVLVGGDGRRSGTRRRTCWGRRWSLSTAWT